MIELLSFARKIVLQLIINYMSAFLPVCIKDLLVLADHYLIQLTNGLDIEAELRNRQDKEAKDSENELLDTTNISK